MNWKPIKRVILAACGHLSGIVLFWTYRMQVHHTPIEWQESGTVAGVLVGYGIVLLVLITGQLVRSAWEHWTNRTDVQSR
jgi:hypothetical protein